MRRTSLRLAEAALAAVLLLALWSGPALAHKVNVFAYAEGGKVFTQSYFNDGAPALGSTIEVFGAAGKRLLTGRTNEAGEFSFPAPAERGDLKIVLIASMGHKGEFTLPAAELVAAAPKAPVSQRSPQAVVSKPAPAAAKPPAPATAPLDEERLRAVVNEALDARLAPLMKMVARGQEGHVRPSEVIGGIGYILGLAGVAAYFASRRRQG